MIDLVQMNTRMLVAQREQLMILLSMGDGATVYSYLQEKPIIDVREIRLEMIKAIDEELLTRGHAVVFPPAYDYLTRFLLKHWADEIGDESAVAMAMRILDRMAKGIFEAMRQPWIYRHGVAYELLDKALGEWKE